MNVKWKIGQLADSFDDRKAISQIVDEVAIHHVQMKRLDSGVLQPSHFAF